MAKERMTLDRLAAMVANEFTSLRREITDGFAAIHRVLGEHSEKLEDHSHRLDRIERKLDNTIDRVDDHSLRLQGLESSKRS